MRLFLAVLFSGKFRKVLEKDIEILRQNAIKGNFVSSKNLHLTLTFLGETEEERLPRLMNLLDSFSGREGFSLTLDRLGSFPGRREIRHDGKKVEERLYWRGLKDEPILMQLQQDLRKGVEGEGFSVDSKKFQPHITLARRCVLRSENKGNLGMWEIRKNQTVGESATMEVNCFYLMESASEGGRLCYRPLHRISLSRQQRIPV